VGRWEFVEPREEALLTGTSRWAKTSVRIKVGRRKNPHCGPQASCSDHHRGGKKAPWARGKKESKKIIPFMGGGMTMTVSTR